MVKQETATSIKISTENTITWEKIWKNRIYPNSNKEFEKKSQKES